MYPIEEFTQKTIEIRENRGIMVAGILTSRFTLLSETENKRIFNMSLNFKYNLIGKR